MGYVREPEGVDFEINGKPLTEQQKLAISDFIKADKTKRTLQASSLKAKSRSKRSPTHPAV